MHQLGLQTANTQEEETSRAIRLHLLQFRVTLTLVRAQWSPLHHYVCCFLILETPTVTIWPAFQP